MTGRHVIKGLALICIATAGCAGRAAPAHQPASAGCWVVDSTTLFRSRTPCKAADWTNIQWLEPVSRIGYIGQPWP